MNGFWAPLYASIPRLERWEYILLEDERDGQAWVGRQFFFSRP